MTTVGIIANPAAGKDIRRLVAHGRVVSNQEKANVLRRVFAGLMASGVERILIMPEPARLAEPARADSSVAVVAEYLEMRPADNQEGSTRAARMMVDKGAACIVTLGGDGTNRVIAKGSGKVPLVPISTGTNNVFPQMVEGTLAGLAAGAIATGAVSLEKSVVAGKRLDVIVDNRLVDIALVDVAVSHESFVGARAIWDIGTIKEIFLTRAEPASIGLSAIGGRLRPTSMEDPLGLYIRLGGQDGRNPTSIQAPVGPGLISDVLVREWSTLDLTDPRVVTIDQGTIALDGEREIPLLPGQEMVISLNPNGPRVVQVERVHELTAAISAGAAK